jgi:hypothetical protein
MSSYNQSTGVLNSVKLIQIAMLNLEAKDINHTSWWVDAYLWTENFAGLGFGFLLQYPNLS